MAKKLCNSKIYHYKNKEEWKEIFIRQYISNNPNSEEQYNKTREPNTPAWETIAGMFGVSKWLDWLDFCELKSYSRANRKSTLTISSHTDLNIV